MGGVVLKVLTGDITKEKVDVIVNSSNDDFTLKAGNPEHDCNPILIQSSWT